MMIVVVGFAGMYKLEMTNCGGYLVQQWNVELLAVVVVGVAVVVVVV